MEGQAIEKLPLYNFLNMLQTGVVFSVMVCLMNLSYCNTLLEQILELNAVVIVFRSFVAVFVFYEIGYILFRLGGTGVEWLLRITKVIKYDKDNYAHFNELKSMNPMLETLSREYAFARTQFTVFLVATIIAFVFAWWVALMCIAVSSIFILTMIKHSNKINKIIEHNKTKNNTNKEEIK